MTVVPCSVKIKSRSIRATANFTLKNPQANILRNRFDLGNFVLLHYAFDLF